MSDITIGMLITTKQNRDAIHIAVVPMLAMKELTPGQHLTNGIVDPFLKEPVNPGQTYWLFLYPNSVTSLRHVWSHPAFPDEPVIPLKSRSEADVWATTQEETK